jgi:hypothetical protein
VGRLQQLEGIDTESFGYPFDRLEGEIALAPLDAPHIRAVDPQHVGEGLLTELPSLAVRAKMLSESSLQVSLHPAKMQRRYF